MDKEYLKAENEKWETHHKIAVLKAKYGGGDPFRDGGGGLGFGFAATIKVTFTEATYYTLPELSIARYGKYFKTGLNLSKLSSNALSRTMSPYIISGGLEIGISNFGKSAEFIMAQEIALRYYMGHNSKNTLTIAYYNNVRSFGSSGTWNQSSIPTDLIPLPTQTKQTLMQCAEPKAFYELKAQGLNPTSYYTFGTARGNKNGEIINGLKYTRLGKLFLKPACLNCEHTLGGLGLRMGAFGSLR